MPSWDTATSRRVEDTSQHEDMEMSNLGTGVGAHVTRAGGGHYSAIPDQPTSPYGSGPAGYRGVNGTHPYASDLGAQSVATGDAASSAYGSGLRAGVSYVHGHSSPGRNPNSGDTSYGGAPSYGSGAQSGYVQQRQDTNLHPSSPAPTYRTYAPTPTFPPTDSMRYAPTTTAIGSTDILSAQARPPSLLQVGRKPLPGSGREV
jgi:hypothetical protein